MLDERLDIEHIRKLLTSSRRVDVRDILKERRTEGDEKDFKGYKVSKVFNDKEV